MNEVERVHEELRAVGQIISESNDISSKISYGEHSAKVLLLVGASYFERQIISAIEEWIHAATQNGSVRHFVLNQAVERKFFSLFSFSADKKNINSFLANFGADYSKWAKEDMKAATIDGNIQQAFLNFCRLRNSLIHSNYATYNIDKTIDEIWTEFERAQILVRWIENSFQRFNETLISPQDAGSPVTLSAAATNAKPRRY